MGTHFLLYCSAITSHLIPTIPLLYCINSSLLTAIYTARQLCAFRSLRQHASHLFYETITGSYCLAPPVQRQADSSERVESAMLSAAKPPANSVQISQRSSPSSSMILLSHQVRLAPHMMDMKRPRLSSKTARMLRPTGSLPTLRSPPPFPRALVLSPNVAATTSSAMLRMRRKRRRFAHHPSRIAL